MAGQQICSTGHFCCDQSTKKAKAETFAWFIQFIVERYLGVIVFVAQVQPNRKALTLSLRLVLELRRR